MGRVSASPYTDCDMAIAQFHATAVATPSIAANVDPSYAKSDMKPLRLFYETFGITDMRILPTLLPRISTAIAAIIVCPALHPRTPAVTYIDFISINYYGQPVPPRRNHIPAQVIEPIADRTTTTNTKHPLRSQGASCMLVTGYKARGENSGAQRYICTVKQSYSSSGCLSLAFHKQANPSFHRGRCLRMEAAVRTA